MKIYASRHDLKSLDYYIGTNLWVKVFSKYDGGYFYAKILSLDKRGTHYLYYNMNLIPEHWFDDDYVVPYHNASYIDRQQCRSTDDIYIFDPVEVFTDDEIQNRLDLHTFKI